VPEDADGRRLDQCLAALSDRWTRSRVRRLIDDARVLHNDRPARPADRVRTGDVLIVQEPAPEPAEARPQDIPLDILHEDSDLLVLNKPAGLVIHPAAGNPDGTLVNALLHHCSDLSGIGGVERPGIVHRLDKDTTGAMVVAKNDRTHAALSLAFSRREVAKTYLALVYGHTAADQGVVDQPIDRHATDRIRMAVRQNGSPARTLWEVRERLDGLTLLACRLITGRTHQIRVHLAHIGHAIVGDPLYAGRQWKNLASGPVQAVCRRFPRQALHAWRLEFEHPGRGERLTFEAPLPEDLETLLHGVRSSAARA
jgi:23S rRNA pseudouridine1911/1915/1917 synthase